MIAFLLLLILLVLLFGASAVKSGIGSIAVIFGGGLLLLVLAGWISSSFSEGAGNIAFWIAIGVIFVLILAKFPIAPRR